MLGQGKRMQIQTKISILQKKAEEFNAKFDELEATGMPLKEISQYIKESEKKSREINLDVLPFDEANKTIEVGFLLSSGLDKTHVVKSEAKEMNLFAEKTFQKVMDKKKRLKSGNDIDPDDEFKGYYYCLYIFFHQIFSKFLFKNTNNDFKGKNVIINEIQIIFLNYNF